MGLTRQASRLPLTALSWGLAAWERSAGLRDFARRRGNEAVQIVAHTPLGRLLPKLVLDDGADEEAARITAAVRTETPAAGATPKPVRKPAPRSGSTATPRPSGSAATSRPSGPTATPRPSTQSGPSTPSGSTAQPRPTTAPAEPTGATEAAREVGAPGAVAAEVEQVVDQLAIPEPESRDDLPIPDFDNISLGSLRSRLRNLSVEQLVILREWEQAHAHRLPVLTALDNRIAKVSAEAYPDATATPATPTRPA